MLVHIFLCTMCVLCQQRTEEGVWCPGTVIKDSYELPCGGWELNLDPLEEQPVLLIAK